MMLGSSKILSVQGVKMKPQQQSTILEVEILRLLHPFLASLFGPTDVYEPGISLICTWIIRVAKNLTAESCCSSVTTNPEALEVMFLYAR